jgi:hypothetical protein
LCIALELGNAAVVEDAILLFYGLRLLGNFEFSLNAVAR